MSQDWFLCLGPLCSLRNLNITSTSAVDQTPCAAPRHAVKQAWKSTNTWLLFGFSRDPTVGLLGGDGWNGLFPPSWGPCGSNPALRSKQLRGLFSKFITVFNIIIGHLRLFKALKFSQIELDEEKTWNITFIMYLYIRVWEIHVSWVLILSAFETVVNKQ